jgi:ADP-heptose:LPS heptosyltransferase
MGPKKILVISEKGLGDALTLLPALRSLKGLYPEIQIDMLASGLNALAPNVKPVLEILDHKSILKQTPEQLAKWLVTRAYDWVWNTENQKSVWREILPRFKNPNWISAQPHRKWPRKDVLAIRCEQIQLLFPEITTYPESFLPLLNEQVLEKNSFKDRHGKANRLIAIQPGGADPNKVWPAEHYLELIEHLLRASRVKVVLFLSPSESHFLNEGFLPQDQRLIVVQEPLNQLVSKLAACDLYIGNDSGFYHLAFALNVPVVGIYSRKKSIRIWSYKSYKARSVYKLLPKPMLKSWKRLLRPKDVLRTVQPYLKSEVTKQIQLGG